MAAAVEHVDLHRRIALNVMKLVGTSPRMLILSFMLPTAFLSMWISNTATTAMMIPIMEAVLIELEATSNDDKLKANNRKLLAMSVCILSYQIHRLYYILDIIMQTEGKYFSIVAVLYKTCG